MESDVIICWNHGGVPKGLVEANFQRPTRVIYLSNPTSWAHAVDDFGWPFPVRGIIKKFAPDVTPLRVAALGFSASCQGVAQLLGSQDGAALDAVVAIDGIHTGYVTSSGKKEVNPNGMKPWFEFGKYAVVNERLFVISHSSVVPPGYASTTETAEYLWNTLTFEPMAFTVPELPPLNAPPTTVKVPAGPATGPARTVEYPSPPWKGKRRCGGLVVLGCSNLDVPRGTADHIYQAKTMLPLMLTAMLAARWNAIDPKAPGQSCFLKGPESHPFAWVGANLGSAVDAKKDASKCAGSKVLPANFITTNLPEKLPSATPPSPSGSSSKQRSLLTSAVLIGGATLGLWWLASKQQVGLLRNPVPDQKERLFRALHGRVVGGRFLHHEYPGLLMWSGSGKYTVYATPDYNEPGTIDVEASSEDGDAISGPTLHYSGALTPEKYLKLVRPYLETDPRRWAGFQKNPLPSLPPSFRGLSSRDLVAAAVLVKDAPFADEDQQVDWALRRYRKFKTEHPEEYELFHETMEPRAVGRAVADFMYYTERAAERETSRKLTYSTGKG